MKWLTKLFTTTVGRKLIMSLTGFFLLVFLVVHLSGNLLLFKQDGGVAFNQYSHFMATNPLIRVMEVVLVLGFLFHILDGIWLSFQNKKSRPKGYVKNSPSANSSWASRSMFLTGSIVFIFLVVHLRSFTVEHRILDNPEPMYDLVVKAFQNVYYTGFYVVAMFLLGFHLLHGFKSAFQSLGLNHSKYNLPIKVVGIAFAIVVPLLYAAIPVYFCIKRPFDIQEAKVEKVKTSGQKGSQLALAEARKILAKSYPGFLATEVVEREVKGEVPPLYQFKIRMKKGSESRLVSVLVRKKDESEFKVEKHWEKRK